MLDNTSILKNKFIEIGGEFLTEPDVLIEKLNHIRCVLFDWDGVLNSGKKGAELHGVFAESDSMGMNLLRYGFTLKHAKIPYFGIISGQWNETAMFLAERENFDYVYLYFKDKRLALEHLISSIGIKPNELAFFYDDVIDLSLSALCGLRILIRRKESVLFNDFVRTHKLADYITGATSGGFAVREASELLLGLMQVENQVFTSRMNYDDSFIKYMTERRKRQTKLYRLDKDVVNQVVR